MGDESDIYIGDPLVLTVCLKTRRMEVVPLSSRVPSDLGGMNAPSVRSFCSWSKEMCCMWRVHQIGQK